MMCDVREWREGRNKKESLKLWERKVKMRN